MTLVEKKVLVYDLSKQMEAIRNKILQLNQEIEAEESKEK